MNQEEILYMEKIDSQEARWRKQVLWEIAGIIVAGIIGWVLHLEVIIAGLAIGYVAVSIDLIIKKRNEFYREMAQIKARIRLYEKTHDVQLLPPDDDE